MYFSSQFWTLFFFFTKTSESRVQWDLMLFCWQFHNSQQTQGLPREARYLCQSKCIPGPDIWVLQLEGRRRQKRNSSECHQRQLMMPSEYGNYIQYRCHFQHQTNNAAIQGKQRCAYRLIIRVRAMKMLRASRVIGTAECSFPNYSHSFLTVILKG